jgi:hypothetical protein
MTDSQLFTIAIVGLMITPIISIVTLLIGQIFTWRMSAENRRRDLEDRAAVAQQARETSDKASHAALEASISARLIAEQAHIAASEAASSVSKLASNQAEIHAAVKDVGVQAKLAYTEANQSNLKIQELQKVLTTALDLPNVPMTETALRESKNKKDE